MSAYGPRLDGPERAGGRRAPGAGRALLAGAALLAALTVGCTPKRTVYVPARASGVDDSVPRLTVWPPLAMPGKPIVVTSFVPVDQRGGEQCLTVTNRETDMTVALTCGVTETRRWELPPLGSGHYQVVMAWAVERVGEHELWKPVDHVRTESFCIIGPDVQC